MSRIRTVKPEFWTSEQVLSCSPIARLMFIGLWNFCDDHGVHPASYVRIKAEVFPGDNFTIEEIKFWISELIANDLLREYAVVDKSYWIVTGWEKHQRIDKPTYRHPLPLSELKNKDNSSNVQRVLDDASSITPRIVADSSITDRNGKEGNGEEKTIREVVPTSRVRVLLDDQATNSKAQEVFSHWQTVMHHPQAKFDAKRERKVTSALKNYTADQLKQAIDGCAKTPYNMGSNDQNQRYDDIELILRDSSHIERFMASATNPPSITTAKSSVPNFMEGAL